MGRCLIPHPQHQTLTWNASHPGGRSFLCCSLNTQTRSSANPTAHYAAPWPVSTQQQQLPFLVAWPADPSVCSLCHPCCLKEHSHTKQTQQYSRADSVETVQQGSCCWQLPSQVHHFCWLSSFPYAALCCTVICSDPMAVFTRLASQPPVAEASTITAAELAGRFCEMVKQGGLLLMQQQSGFPTADSCTNKLSAIWER